MVATGTTRVGTAGITMPVLGTNRSQHGSTPDIGSRRLHNLLVMASVVKIMTDDSHPGRAIVLVHIFILNILVAPSPAFVLGHIVLIETVTDRD